MSAIDHRPFPKGALMAASALVIFSLIAVTVVRLAKLQAPPAPMQTAANAPAGAVLASRHLRFEDRPGKIVAVVDARSGRDIATLEHGGDGFVRGAVRALVRDRRINALGPDAATFELTEWSDGRLTLLDPATGAIIDLRAFGPTNRAAFARYLPAHEAAR
jgi:putative photosynthetic complex assembly protein